MPAPSGGSPDWQTFRKEFVTGGNERWLGRVAFSLVGPGTVWLDALSLKEAAGGAELLWEADVNRPIRGYYNPLDCFMLDQLVEAAERNGIYLMLCAITRDLYMNTLSKVDSPEYRLATMDAKKFMRYAVARWGYSTSVAAWEYWNEMDPGKPTDRFYAEVGNYLAQIDIYHHLRTTSTWAPSARDCRHPQIDIAQEHHYMRPDDDDFKDEVESIIRQTRFLRDNAPSKPALIGEFGLADAKWGLSDYMKQDREGVHFHNCLWASALAGSLRHGHVLVVGPTGPAGRLSALQTAGDLPDRLFACGSATDHRDNLRAASAHPGTAGQRPRVPVAGQSSGDLVESRRREASAAACRFRQNHH